MPGCPVLICQKPLAPAALRAAEFSKEEVLLGPAGISPETIAIGVRAGRTSATVRFGRRALVIENGITSDAVAVIEGEVEPLLELATGSIVRELGTIRLRGH